MFNKTFEIKLENENANEFYKNHGTFHDGDAGLDLFILEDKVLKARETTLVDLGISCQSKKFTMNPFKWIKNGFYEYFSYYLIPRSSISKTPLLMANSIGLIDQGYQGKIKMPLFNTSNFDFKIKKGERYAQLVNADLSPIEMKIVSEHKRNTSRGSGGFGSTN